MKCPLMKSPLVTVVIPTYNREAVLRQTLERLGSQTLPADQIEVCVVDDGSTDATSALSQAAFPFVLRILRRNRQGATLARNAGAGESHGEVLIFLDDDIWPDPGAVEILARGCLETERTIMLGTLLTPQADNGSVFARLNAPSPFAAQASTQDQDLTASDCLTGFLAVRRADFFELGMFQDPTGGWPNWDDVDFGYRATQAGFRLRRSAQARAEHWDRAMADLAMTCRRWQAAGHSAARLLCKYPAMLPALPMFADKTRIAWRADPPRLVARKLVRRAVSTPGLVSILEWLAHTLEQRWPAEPALRRLYRWIIGAYIFRGFQDGTKELQC
jgi:glycosyltransferase involved in cell wall biosynthesis